MISWGEIVRKWKAWWRAQKPQPPPPAPAPAPEPSPAPPPPPPTPTPTPAPGPAGVDGVTWASWRNICSNGGWGRLNPTAARIDRALRSARWQRGDLIRMDYDSIAAWPRKDMGGWASWGGVCVGWLDGDTLVSGWFDHLAREGQTVKDTKNWRNGYLTTQPDRARPLYIYLISTDGKHRTNLCRLE